MEKEDLRINKLIMKISLDNEKSLKELFKLTKEKLYYVAIKYLFNPLYAEDVLMEAYVKIYKNSLSFKMEYNGMNWMYEIVKNTALDFNKKLNKETILSFDEDYMVKEDSSYNFLEKEKVRLAMSVLSNQEREIIEMKFYKKYTIAQIAEKLGITSSTVYRIYTAALKKMKEVL